MKTNIYKLLGTTLLAVSLATISLTTPAQAQVDANPEPVIVDEDNDFVEEDNDFDWGWLGLLGLLGLAGLAGRKRHEHTVRTTDHFPESTTRRTDL